MGHKAIAFKIINKQPNFVLMKFTEIIAFTGLEFDFCIQKDSIVKPLSAFVTDEN